MHTAPDPAEVDGSPVSDDGCGLKLNDSVQVEINAAGSPVSDDGCGLKQRCLIPSSLSRQGSPVSDDGCGLKRADAVRARSESGIARQRRRVWIETHTCPALSIPQSRIARQRRRVWIETT